jgi:arylsulfatase A-like enzyme
MSDSRIEVVARIFLMLACALSTRSTLAEDAVKRPNIVLVVADDMGYGDSSAHWQTDLETPVMADIARSGICFTQFRVNPLCAPTRASLMTGLYSLECGMWRGPGQDSRGPEPADGWPDTARRIRDDITLLPQHLRAAGYVTGMFGKWHLGYDAKNLPNSRGFNDFIGFLGGAHPYWLRANSRILRNGEPFVASGHTTDLFADAAIAFIRSNRDRPFFCYLPFNAVHGPLRNADRPVDSARPDWLEYYERKGVAQPRRDYNAVMSHADARVGDLRNTLRELGLEERTLIIYLSDNGGILHTYPSNNGPLRGGKGSTYEGGIRVPAVMQWTGVIPAGSVTHADAVHFDIYSTILDAAGICIPATNGRHRVSGVSLLPLVRSGGRTALPERYLFWDLYGDVAAMHGPWKLVGQIPNHRGRFDQAVRDAAAAQLELYNLQTDQGEQQNVAGQFPELYRDLAGRHLDWLRQFAP